MNITGELHPPHMKITAELPLEIIQSGILPRLPVKSLVRFMCVCKQWQSFLSTPQFARMQLNHVTNYKLLLLDFPTHIFCTIDCEAPYRCLTPTRSIPFKADLGDVMVVATFNGLVCVTIRKTQELVFRNPLTGAYKKLSSFDHHGFDDSNAIGFYNDSSNDYKLLHVVPKGALGAYIYSWRLDSWRMIQSLENIQHLSTYWWSHAVFSDESLYFIVKNKSGRGESHIIVFDVKSEKFREQPSPPIPPRGALFPGKLVVVNGFIHLFVFYELFVAPQIDLWKMDCDGWIKVAAFSQHQGVPLTTSLISMMHNRTRLRIKRDDNHVYKINWLDFARECLSLCGGWQWFTEREVIFVESLVPPNP